jgi:hypothetical protein
MSDEPSSPADLGAIDLSLSFAPAWAKEADSSRQIARLAAKHGGGDDRADRPGKRWEDRGPRQDRRPPRRDAGGGGPRPDRPKRREGAGRDDRRPERRPEREARPEPILSGWDVQFLPDRAGVDGLARQIKASAKTYPLFDLARLVLEKSERYFVQLKRTSESATSLYQLKIDGSLWVSEAEAVAHALAQQLDKFYRRERVAVDPPKGVYPFVAVCGMSGTLLGPPNYHDYQAKVRQLHAERFANVPFEVFKSRIRMDRDEESINRWKQEQSTKDVFYPVDPAAPQPPARAESAAEAPKEDAPAAEMPPAEEAPTAEAETIAETAAPPADEAPAPEPAAAPEAREQFASLADVERHFRQHHLAGAIVKIRERVAAPGPAAMNDSSPAVLQLTRGAWEELSRFPLPLAHTLGQQLTGKGLQIFKTADNITCVGVARPRYLDRQATPVSEALSGILDYLEGHASTPRPEQMQALLAMRTITEGEEESAREAALARDLSWLLHEGHVIDFARRGLEAARPPKVRPSPDPKAGKTNRPTPEAETKSAPASEPVPAPEPENPEAS